MKKIIAVVAFFTITVLGTTNAVAQERGSKIEVSNDARVFTHRLVQEFNISEEQQDAVKNAFMQKVIDTKAITKNSTSRALKVINLEFDNKLKAILTEVQYKKYKLLKN